MSVVLAPTCVTRRVLWEWEERLSSLDSLFLLDAGILNRWQLDAQQLAKLSGMGPIYSSRRCDVPDELVSNWR